MEDKYFAVIEGQINTSQQETAFKEYILDYDSELSSPFWEWYCRWCEEEGLYNDRSSNQFDIQSFTFEVMEVLDNGIIFKHPTTGSLLRAIKKPHPLHNLEYWYLEEQFKPNDKFSWRGDKVYSSHPTLEQLFCDLWC